MVVFDYDYFYEEKKFIGDNKIEAVCKECKRLGEKKIKFKASNGISSNLKMHQENSHGKMYNEWFEKKLSEEANTPKRLKLTIKSTPLTSQKKTLFNINNQSLISKYGITRSKYP